VNSDALPAARHRRAAGSPCANDEMGRKVMTIRSLGYGLFRDYYNQSETAIWISTLLGSPYVGDNGARYTEQSPITWLGKAVTPTLILHNVGDPNAPVTQSYALHHALRDRGVKTRMLLRGIDGHGYGDPFSHRQVHSATLGWLQENCTDRD
jgi:dipeptidyl aminopeptidase/acylaminoacyl peptidase